MARAMIGAVLAALLASTPATAEPGDVGEAIDALFAPLREGQQPGCGISVAKDGKTLIERGYGQADLEHAAPIGPETVFEAGSVSKQFTAAAILLLVEDGKMRLDDDVRRYLPELPDYGTPITIDHLLTHTSGLRDWGALSQLAGWPRGMRVYTHSDVIDIAARQTRLNHAPGAIFSYTNTGYNLLAVIVERVSGTSFSAFTKTRLFDRLGMNRSSWRDDFRAIVPDRAIAYEFARNAWLQAMPFENAYGNGGLLTTTHDLLLWNEALSQGMLGTGVAKAMIEASRLNDSRRVNYGRGLFLKTYHGAVEIGHGGSTGGYRSWVARYPHEKLSIAILCNGDTTRPPTWGHQIADLFLPAPKPGKQAGTASLPAGVEGLYVNRLTGMPLTIKISEGKLFADRDPLAPIRLGRWRGDDGEIEFGGAEALTFFDEDGNALPYVRAQPPGQGPLAEFEGRYASEEVGAGYMIATQDGKLMLRIERRPDFVVPLRALYRDAFFGPGLLLRFQRGADGKVIGLSAGLSRVWDVRFNRVAP